MAQLTALNKFSNLKTISDLTRFLSAFVDQLVSVFNGNIDFVSNIRASGPTVVSFSGPSDVQKVSHGLGIVPRGTITLTQSAAASIYKPNGSQYNWTTDTIYLQASAAVVATIYII